MTLETRLKELEQVRSSDQQMEVQAVGREEGAEPATDAQTDVAAATVESPNEKTDGKSIDEVEGEPR